MSKLGALREKAVAEGLAVSSVEEEVPPLPPEAPIDAEFIAGLMAGAAGAAGIPDRPPEAFADVAVAPTGDGAPQGNQAPAGASSPPAGHAVTQGGEPHAEAPSAPQAGMDTSDLLHALKGAIERLGPARTQAEVLAAPDAQGAWGEVRGLTAAALALGMASPVEQLFRRYGAPGEGLLNAAQLKAPLNMAVAGFKPGAAPLAATQAKAAAAAAGQQAMGGPGGGGGGGGGAGSVGAALAKLVAAPVTLPMAAGSRVWQLMQTRFGPRPKVQPGVDGFSVIRQQFDDAAGRAIDQIAHLRSGPMKSFLTEMSQDPLRPSEQLRRMQGDKKGTYFERAKQLRELSAQPEVQGQYKKLNDAMEHLQYRSRRLAEYGHEAGMDVEDIIGDKLESVSKAGEGIPMTDGKGKLAELRESLDALIERIREFLRTLFARPGASP
ncbi:hypothetical protein VDR65_10630 [Xanthomonas campestris pv. campestris]|nr:hypothetical protein [Xanthomonas campestris pv. campestris]MEB1724781.1 hypothetical protein [Xanthomonas campestris pv. campestris]MEB1896886.1 hypothetical protein [Xanthomonas campestris pv. campestris]